MTDGSPIRLHWHPHMVEMIREIYTGYSRQPKSEEEHGREQNTVVDDATPVYKCCLPPAVKLEDALAVLNYFGLDLDDPRSEIDFSRVDVLTRLRGHLFLKQRREFEEARDEIVHHIEMHPKNETSFLVLGKDRMDGLVLSPELPVPLLMDQDHFKTSYAAYKSGCVMRKKSREGLISALQDVGLLCAQHGTRTFELWYEQENEGFPVDVEAFFLVVEIPEEPEENSKRRRIA